MPNLKSVKENKNFLVLLSVMLIVVLWQLLFILFNPDPDTDAYAHFIISRDIVRNPVNFSVHWVWLPLFHYIGAFFVFLGSSMQPIRFINVLIWFLMPVLLYVFLMSKESTKKYALVASIIAALSPIGILMGTTAQMEPLFALFMLLFAFLFEKKDYYSSSFVLALACLLRYEAWGVLALVSVYVIYLRISEARNIPKAKKISILSVIIVPFSVIFLWSLLRYYSDGQWLSFLSGTQHFANDALGESSSVEGGMIKFIWDLIYYPLWIPFIYYGIPLFFIPFGFKKFIRENPVLSITGLAILGFITVSWLMKSNLGLNRHFSSLVPLYSVLISYGLFELVEKTKSFFENKAISVSPLRLLNSLRFWVIITFINLTVYTVMWLYIYNENNKGVFDEKYITVEYLKTLSDKSIIVCNDPVLEVLSGVDYRLFDHYWMKQNDETVLYIKGLMKYNNNVYVIADEGLKNYLKYNSIIMFESGINPKTGKIIYILKII